jgi:hypothetical protein
MAIFPNGMSLPSQACSMFKELTAFNGDISEWTSF